MADQVAELSPGDIDRGTGISTNNPAPEGFRQEAPAAAPMTETQTAAIAHLGELRRQAGDPSLDGAKREAIINKMSELSKHAFLGAKAPAWYGEAKPDAAQLDTRTLADAAGDIPVGAGLDPITDGDMERLVSRGVVAGQMDRESATTAAQFCKSAQLPATVANVLMDRASKHVNDGYGFGVELTAEDVAELRDGCARAFGSIEKAETEIALARKYLESAGGAKLLAEVDQRAGSLGFDPRLILQLSYLARTKGLAAK